MKKLLIFMLAGALLTGCNKPADYSKTVTVYMTVDDTVVCEDEMGYLWDFEDKTHQYSEFDVLHLEMSENGTPDNIFDDEIVEHRLED